MREGVNETPHMLSNPRSLGDACEFTTIASSRLVRQPLDLEYGDDDDGDQ